MKKAILTALLLGTMASAGAATVSTVFTHMPLGSTAEVKLWENPFACSVYVQASLDMYYPIPAIGVCVNDDGSAVNYVNYEQDS